MTESTREWLTRLLALSSAERAELAAALIESLDGDANYAEAWKAEIARRVAELESGDVEAVPAETVLAELRARLP